MFILTKPLNPKFNKIGSQIFWIETNPDGTFKKKHLKPKIGYFLIMDPYKSVQFTYSTEPITQIIENIDSHITFKTQKSEYKLIKP